MGYRSEVAIKCEQKAYERFEKVFTDGEMYISPDKILFNHVSKEYTLYWDLIKWYEDFEGVSAITKVMRDLDDEHVEGDELGYRMLRIGEDDDDVERRENDWNIELWMIRKIDLDGCGEEMITQR